MSALAGKNLMSSNGNTTSFSPKRKSQSVYSADRGFFEDNTNARIAPVCWRRKDACRETLFSILSFLTGGLLSIFSYRYNKLRVYLNESKCNPMEAETVEVRVRLMSDNRVKTIFARLERQIIDKYNIESMMIFTQINSRRYYASRSTDWLLCPVLDVPTDFSRKFLCGGTTAGEIAAVKRMYGPNKIEVPSRGWLKILLIQLCSPFFIFQYFSVILWCFFEDYIAFSMVILIITVFAIYANTYEEIYNLRRLSAMAGYSTKVTMLDTDGREREVDDTELAPGDRIVIVGQSTLPADIVLINGHMVVDESMLTGETVPLSKSPFLDGSKEEIDPLKHGNHLAFAGTKVKKALPGSIGVVYRTGFRSAKGQLIASLLEVKNISLGFFSDTTYVIVFLVIYSTLLYGWAASSLKDLGASNRLLVIKYLDALTIAVPPSLLTCLIVATAIAIRRLNERKIFVSETGRVNWAGAVECVCFDKTGTLTSDKLRFEKVIQPNPPRLPQAEVDRFCRESMACNHDLSFDPTCNDIVGDPLEVELFRASTYLWEETEKGTRKAVNPTDSKVGCSIARHFEFTSERMRSASLVERFDGDVVYYLKGSPEIIFDMVNPSTIPANERELVDTLTRGGHRIIALAYRTFNGKVQDHMKKNQEQLEGKSDLNYLALVSLSNKLKEDTNDTIKSLSVADISCKMITGDHLNTALSVSLECFMIDVEDSVYIIDQAQDGNPILLEGMDHKLSDMSVEDFLVRLRSQNAELADGSIDNALSAMNKEIAVVQKYRDSKTSLVLACTGNGLHAVRRSLDPIFLFCLIKDCKVFARAKPGDKKMVVEKLIEGFNGVGTQVLFCGDGANDMSALRAATVGVSLCAAETSIAAPVTSREQSPKAVIDVLKEGRCSLVTAYVLVNFNVMFGTIQLFMAISLYRYGLQVGDYIYLLHDLFYTLVLSVAISMAQPADQLGRDLPPLRYFTPRNTVNLVLQLITFPCFQEIGLASLHNQNWYTEHDPGHIEDVDDMTKFSWENSVIAIIGLGQLLIASIASSVDHPYRQPWYYNPFQLFAMQGQILLLMDFNFNEGTPFCRFMQMKPFYSIRFCWVVLLILLANLLLSLFIKSFSKKIAMYLDKYLPVFSIEAARGAREFELLRDVVAASISTSASSGRSISTSNGNTPKKDSDSASNLKDNLSSLELSNVGNINKEDAALV